jgi:hypothetical protein
MNDAQEFHLPIDELLKEVPMLLRGQMKSFLQKLDSLDLNHDHKRDLAQLARLAAVGAVVIDKANDVIDFDKLGEWLAAQPFIKDKALATETIKLICHAVAQV